MRKLACILAIGLTCSVLLGQNDQKSISDFNFESVTNPAFLLLGETPTAIYTPNNIKSLGLYLSNGFSNSNIAIEVNPYWWFFGTMKNKSYRGYRGIVEKEGLASNIDPFNAFKVNSSISIGYIDKKFEGFPDKKKVFAVGGRFTLFELYGEKRTNDVLKTVVAIESGFSDKASTDTAFCEQYAKDGTIPENMTTAATKFLEKYPVYQSKYSNEYELLKAFIDQSCTKNNDFYFNTKNIKPVLRIDGAIGYSMLYKEAEFNANTANRFGTWLTADLALKFSDQDYLHILAIGKYVDDGFNIDSNGIYFTENYIDYGGKLEIELNKFKLSYEYLSRSGEESKFRSVGNLTYQLNKTMSITGGFGKDFPKDDNLVSILGINWGLNSGEKEFSKD